MFSKWGFLFLLILAIFATGCRGAASIIDGIPIPPVSSVADGIPIPPVSSVADGIPIPPVSSVADDIALMAKANRVVGVLDNGISNAHPSLADESNIAIKEDVKKFVLSFSCNVTKDALQSGSIDWEDVKENAVENFTGSLFDKFELMPEDVDVSVLFDMMDALKGESDSDPYWAGQICSRLGSD